MTTPDYPIRYVAYLDILGFRAIIEQLNSGHIDTALVRELLLNVHRPQHDALKQTREEADLRVQSISDAVAISSSDTAAGLAHMFAAIDLMARKLLQRGYFVRGAVAKGRLFHDKEVVFGEGLVQAFGYESTVARYPRIMIPRIVAGEVRAYMHDKQFERIFEGHVRGSSDGPQFLHVLWPYERIKDDIGTNRQDLLAELMTIRDLIQQRLEEAIDRPRDFEKVHWFADYWNQTFSNIDGLPKIEGPGLEVHLIAE